MNRPAQLYHPSEQRYDQSDKTVDYPEGLEVKKVHPGGHIHFEGNIYFIGEVFVGLNVGLKLHDNAEPEVFFANVRLGKLIANSKDPFRPSAYMDPCHP